MMILQVIVLISTVGWLSIDCLVAIPPKYRQAEIALNRYISSSSSDPLIHSLLNVLIHVNQAKAFISDEAIQEVLEHMKEFDQQTHGNNEMLFWQIIYGSDCKLDDKDCVLSHQNRMSQPTADLKQRIVSELDKFFENDKSEEYWSPTDVNEGATV